MAHRTACAPAPPRLPAQALAALLGGRPLALVAELAIREPRLLAQPLDTLAQRFDTVAASFGSFRCAAQGL